MLVGSFQDFDLEVYSNIDSAAQILMEIPLGKKQLFDYFPMFVCGLKPGFVSWVSGTVFWVLAFVFLVLGLVFWVPGFVLFVSHA